MISHLIQSIILRLYVKHSIENQAIFSQNLQFLTANILIFSLIHQSENIKSILVDFKLRNRGGLLASENMLNFHISTNLLTNSLS